MLITPQLAACDRSDLCHTHLAFVESCSYHYYCVCVCVCVCGFILCNVFVLQLLQYASCNTLPYAVLLIDIVIHVRSLTPLWSSAQCSDLCMACYVSEVYQASCPYRGMQASGRRTHTQGSCAPTCVEQAPKIAEIVEVAATAVSFFIKALKLLMMRRTVPSPQVIGI